MTAFFAIAQIAVCVAGGVVLLVFVGRKVGKIIERIGEIL